MPSAALAKTKPEITLAQHAADVEAAALSVLSPARSTVFARLGVPPDSSARLVASVARLHDIGKATEEWQGAVGRGADPPQHALTGFLGALWALGASSFDGAADHELAGALAVLGHHGQMHDQSWSPERFTNQRVTPIPGEWEQLGRETCPAFLRAPYPTRLLAEKVRQAKASVGARAPDGRIKALYCLLLALLVDADHAASGGSQPRSPRFADPRLPGPPTSFQAQAAQRSADALCLMAGCGSGKTAAALMRAAELARAHGVDRVVFCLPTRFTSNSLLRDMSSAAKYAYPPADVGLVHAEALHVLRSLAEGSDETTDDDEAIRRLGIRYEHAVTISTIDHLIMSLYHGYRFSDRAFGNLLTSLVVFDEVHAYDTTTLNAIREAMGVLGSLKVPVMAMSATLPSTRRSFLGFGPSDTILESGNRFRPFVVRTMDGPLTERTDRETVITTEARREIAAAAGTKLAVYVNQVERAKAVARAARELMPDVLVICYHGELAPRDRIRLEGDALGAFRRDDPIVLVATQAAELSLDISAELMISELAPADVLVQRAGRLNRRGLSPLPPPSARVRAGFQCQFIIAPLPLPDDLDAPAPAALPYNDVECLRVTMQRAPAGAVFDFDAGVEWCESAVTNAIAVRDCGVVRASMIDAVFGRRPAERWGEEGDTDAVHIRDRDQRTRGVVPAAMFRSDFDDWTEIVHSTVPMRQGAYYRLQRLGLIETRHARCRVPSTSWRAGREFTVPVEVVMAGVPYDADDTGFDLRNLGDEMAHLTPAIEDQFL